MGKEEIVNFSRRRFLELTAAAGADLTLGICLPGCGREKSATTPSAAVDGATAPAQTAADMIAFNAFVRVAASNQVTIVIKHLEMGQGTYTGLATVVADEMDAAWEQVRVISAPANTELYKNLFWGAQGTGGSTAMANSFTQMRKAGASARHMLVSAAAKKWNVAADEIKVVNGVLSHPPSGMQASFGELAELAAGESVPDEVFLKDSGDFHLIGTDVMRQDSRDKVYGQAIYTQDIKLPDMVVALVAHPPRFGATVKSYDPGKSKAVKGVVDVVQIPAGVAVLARDFWSAKKGRDMLHVAWDESGAFNLGSDELMAQYRATASQAGAVARNSGNADAALKKADKILQASYEFPFLAHAAMEPLDCVVQYDGNGCQIWNGCQSQTADQAAVAKLLGLKPEQVTINTLYAGGSFGRRANPHVEFRRALLRDQPRHLGVLNLAVEKSGWNKPLGAGRGRGVAVHKSFNTYVAQVAEVTVKPDRSFAIDRVVIAVDCGIGVNPDVIRAQMEGGMGFGLAPALGSKITFSKGRVEQSNFHDYMVLRMNDMPLTVEVYIVKSDEPPTGVGEPGTPVIAPAVANALYHATGQRLRSLPLKLSG